MVFIENTSFIYIRHKNLFIVAITRGNPNVQLLVEYLYQKLRIVKSYLGDTFIDQDVRDHFTLMYELFDETMDYGYPQNCAIDVLRLYINLGSVLQNASAVGNTGAALTAQITGVVDWRREGIKYRNNEVHIDIYETLTLIASMTGQVLRSEVHGKVILKTALTGMPECKFGLNDKLIMEREEEGGGGGRKTNAVEIDDCTFHRCVSLGEFESKRTITFTPPDGEFELMRYRAPAASHPFRLIPNIAEAGKTKLCINLKVFAEFPEDKIAANVVIKIPVPTSTANARINVAKGRARYEPGERALMWRISSFPGMSEATFSAEIDLLPATREKVWVRPPISIDFRIPMYAASGVQVRFLKVYEKKNSYQTQRWVKYESKAGEYQVRI